LYDYLLPGAEGFKVPLLLPCHEEVDGKTHYCDPSRSLLKRTERKITFSSFFFPPITVNASVEPGWLVKNSYNYMKNMGC